MMMMNLEVYWDDAKLDRRLEFGVDRFTVALREIVLHGVSSLLLMKKTK